MNEHFSLSRMTRVELALEAPFRLGGILVRPAALEIETAEGGVESLEPRVMQVLVALHRGRGEPVSRDSLIDLCWEGRFVGEDALNRCIARLRKALAADPGVRIDTIAKVGYRLRTDAPEVPAGPLPEGPAPAPLLPTSPLADRRLLAGGAIVAGVMIASVAGFLLLRPSPGWSAVEFRPLTAETGVETHPALSPSGELLIYAAGRGGNGTRDLFMRGVSEGAPLRLTHTPEDEVSPAFSPRADRIAFSRQTYGAPCQIVVRPIPAGAERVVGRCTLETSTRVAWLDENTLLISDRTAWSQPRRIRALDVRTGTARDVTQPPAESLGDADPLPSHDGRRIAFRRTLAHGIDDLHVLDVRTGRLREITSDGWKAHGATWAENGHDLFFATNRGGDFGLWSIDTRRGGEPRRVSLGVRSFGRMSADHSGRIAVETGASRVNLARLGAGGPTALTSSNGYDWDPAVGRDGTIVFVSDQAGGSDLWTLGASGHPARITSLRASYVHSPSWSADQQRVAFVAAREHKAEVFTVRPDGSELRQVTRTGSAKVDPVFTPDGAAVIYAGWSSAGWRLMRQELSGGEPRPVPGGEGWQTLRLGADGRLYGARSGGHQVLSLPLAGGRATVVPGARLDDEYSFAAGPDGLYVIQDRLGGGAARVVRYPYAGGAGEMVATAEDAAWRPALSVNPVTGEVVFARWMQDDADIGLLQVRRAG